MPISISVQFSALNISNRARYDIPALTREVDEYMEQFLENLVDSIAEYPPEPTGTTYERRGWAGGIRGSWDIVTRSSGNVNRLVKTLTNTASDRPSGRRYAIYVQGQWQTMMHRATGWQRVDEAAEALRRRYRSDLQEIYKRHIYRGP